MPRFISRHVLDFVVFLTGAAVLIVEVLATRILAPYFGNTIYTISSILGVILAALSIGYYLGGRMADERPSQRYFYGIIFLSGLSVFLLRGLTQSVPGLSRYFSIATGPLVASVVLFFLPSFLLGLLSPFAVKLQLLRTSAGIGRVTGEIFFYSTIGSIAGSLLAGFYLVPTWGTSAIIEGLGALLTAMGVAGVWFGGERRRFPFELLALSAAAFGGTHFLLHRAQSPGTVYAGEGVYEFLTIIDARYKKQPARFLRQNTNLSSAMFLDSTEIPFDYCKYFALVDLFAPKVRETLVLGAGAYTVPKGILKRYPEAHVHVAEIEPMLFDLAKTYFNLNENPRLENHLGDGRRFLADSPKRYELIFGDVYFSPTSVPVHFTTHEFFALVRARLATNGIFVMNFSGYLEEGSPSLLASEVKTLQSVFPNSYLFAVDSREQRVRQNYILVGQNGDVRVEFSDAAVSDRMRPFIGADLSQKIIDIGAMDLSGQLIFTDDYAPVEYLTVRAFRKGQR